jgi:hypothetical protein
MVVSEIGKLQNHKEKLSGSLSDKITGKDKTG